MNNMKVLINIISRGSAKGISVSPAMEFIKSTKVFSISTEARVSIEWISVIVIHIQHIAILLCIHKLLLCEIELDPH